MPQKKQTARAVENNAGGGGRKELLLLFLAGSRSGLGRVGFGHALLELIDAPGGIDELLHPGVEGMASIANPDQDYRLGGAGLDDVAAGATNLRFHILRMCFSFHNKRAVRLPLASRLTSENIRQNRSQLSPRRRHPSSPFRWHQPPPQRSKATTAPSA